MSEEIVGSALSPIQTAIGAKLVADTTLTAMITGVFDDRFVPDGQDFPYVTIGNMTETDDSTFDTLGYADTVELNIYSRQPGAQEAQQILANLNRLLHRQPLTLTDMSHVGTWLDLAQSLDDPDDKTITHMPVRYRIGAGEN